MANVSWLAKSMPAAILTHLTPNAAISRETTSNQRRAKRAKPHGAGLGPEGKTEKLLFDINSKASYASSSAT